MSAKCKQTKRSVESLLVATVTVVVWCYGDDDDAATCIAVGNMASNALPVTVRQGCNLAK